MLAGTCWLARSEWKNGCWVGLRLGGVVEGFVVAADFVARVGEKLLAE